MDSQQTLLTRLKEGANVIECRECGKLFLPWHNRRKFCSPECGMLTNKRRSREKYRARRIGLVGQVNCRLP